MDTKGNLYIKNPDGSTREVIPPDQVVTPEPQPENQAYKPNRHERRKAAARARRKKKAASKT